jgi:hypothetical protein
MANPRFTTVALAGALTAALALAAAPLVAQDATPPAATAAGKPAPDGASIRLDFGAGRMVKIDCGDAAIDACIAAATPLIDKVAATPAVEGWKGDHGKMGHGKRWHDMDGHGGKGHGKGKGRDGDGPMGGNGPADAPLPPPVTP